MIRLATIFLDWKNEWQGWRQTWPKCGNFYLSGAQLATLQPEARQNNNCQKFEMIDPTKEANVRAGLPGVTASVLTSRLSQLERVGVVDYDERLGMYALRDTGRDLLPVLEGLSRWSLSVPGHDTSRFISPAKHFRCK